MATKGIRENSLEHIKICITLLKAGIADTEPLAEEDNLKFPELEGHCESLEGLCEKCTEIAAPTFSLNQQRIKQLQETNSTLLSDAKTRAILEDEIEELTATLFDQANRMVVQESRLRHDLWIRNQNMQNKIMELSNILQTLKEENTTLKSIVSNSRKRNPKKSSKVADMGSAPCLKGSNSTDKASCSLSSEASSGLQGSRFFMDSPVYVDGIALSEFQEFLKSLSLSKVDTKFDISQTPFVKKIILEEVESSFNFFKILKPSIKKKLHDGIVKGLVLCREVSSAPEVLVSKNKCHACGLGRLCNFKVKILDCKIKSSVNLVSEDNFDAPGDSLIVDQFCRDKIMSIASFYRYLSQLQSGALQLPLLHLFRLLIDLRVKMFQSKVGSFAVMLENSLDNVKIIN